MKTETFEPLALKPWMLPDSYAGAEWPDHFRFLGQHRGSDCLARANFDAGVELLQRIPEPQDWPHDDAPWQVVRESHWAVGWVEWIAIHKDAAAHLEAADKAACALEDYPVLDESKFSEYEDTEAQETWKNCYNVKARIAYIRMHESQFEFRDLADMLGCVRGNYFAGYASELIS